MTAERIFISGMSGFVGSWLAKALVDARPNASLVDPQDSGTALDICQSEDVDRFIKKAKPDIVVHLAAQSSTRRNDPSGAAETWRINVTGSTNLAISVGRHCPNATVLFASSSEVYGASFFGGFVDESTPCVPLQSYARSKLLAEQTFAAILPDSARLLIVRAFNHTGPGQTTHFVLPDFARQVARIESGAQEARILVGNIEVQRDFLDVRDVVQAYISLLDHAETLPRRFLCNVSSGRVFRIRTLVEALQNASRRPFEIKVEPARLRPFDLEMVGGRSELIRSVTGWSPKIEIEEMLDSLLDHARHELAIA